MRIPSPLVVWFAGATALASVALAIAITADPSRTVPAALALGLMAVALGLGALERWLSLLLLGGALVLEYGFANVGLQVRGMPIPLAELLIVALVGMHLIGGRSRPPSAVLVPLMLYTGFVAFRLAVDYPEWGITAVRDSTTAIESFVLIAGYGAVARDGLQHWIRSMKWIFVLLLAYASLSPWKEQLASIGPVVGLQRDVPLLGFMEGNVAVVAAGLFFAIYTRGITRALLLTWVVGLVGLFQARALYLVLPIGVILLGWALRRHVTLPLRVAAAGLLAVMALAFVSASGVSGRLGTLSPSFYVAHVQTLLGEEGPGSGTVDHRLEWTELALDEWRASPLTTTFGVGLGPDLAFGFRLEGDVDVRKPHNDYLEALTRTGVVGLVLLAWLLIALLRPAVRAARRHTGPERSFCAWALAASVTYLLVAAAQPLLAFPYGTVPVFFWLGMAAAVASPRQEASARRSSPRL